MRTRFWSIEARDNLGIQHIKPHPEPHKHILNRMIHQNVLR